MFLFLNVLPFTQREVYAPLSTAITSASSRMTDIFLPQYQPLPGALFRLIQE